MVDYRLRYGDKTPNRSCLNLLNFTKVALQTGKDSLRGLLLGSQVLWGVTNQIAKGKRGCKASTTVSNHLDSPTPAL